jgi:hypothetical protein
MNLSNQENIDYSFLLSSYHLTHIDISYHFGGYHLTFPASDTSQITPIQPIAGSWCQNALAI